MSFLMTIHFDSDHITSNYFHHERDVSVMLNQVNITNRRILSRVLLIDFVHYQIII